MAAIIRQWVGQRPRGKGWDTGNDPFDVSTVQKLLQAASVKLNDGDIDPKMANGVATPGGEFPFAS